MLMSEVIKSNSYFFMNIVFFVTVLQGDVLRGLTPQPQVPPADLLTLHSLVVHVIFVADVIDEAGLRFHSSAVDKVCIPCVLVIQAVHQLSVCVGAAVDGKVTVEN